MLNKLLFKYQRLGQMIIAFLGTLLGLTFLLISLQFYFDLRSVLQQEEEIFGPNTFILQKKVTGMNTLSLGNTRFTEKEIKDLEKKDFIVKVDPFVSSDFDVGIKLSVNESIPPLYIDAFVQSIPKKYFSDVDADWEWTEESEFVPIVMPEDYLTLYNHAFAPSQGLPQLAKEAIQSAVLKMEIKNKNGVKKLFTCKIVGLTNKVNSILAPTPFIKYCNAKYGNSEKPKNPSRIVIQTKNDAYNDIEQLIKDKNYETNISFLDKAKIKSYLSVIMIALLIVNFIILVLSLLAFIQYSQIVIYKTEYEIQTLLRIGYSVKKITWTYIRFFAILFALIATLSIIFVITFKFWSLGYMEKMGFEFEPGIIPLVFYTAFGLYLIFTGFNLINIRQLIKKLL